MYAWIMSRARFAIGKTLRFSDGRTSISIVDIWHQGIPARDYWQRGLAVKRMPGNWSIIDRDAASNQQAALGQDLSSWLQENGIRKHASSISLRRFWQGQQDLVEAEYTKRLSSSTGHVLIANDKDMPFDCMSTIMVGLVLLDAGRWSIASISPQQLNVLIYGASLFAVPAFLRKGPLPKVSFAPYMHPFVKSKCFSDAGGRTCSKPNHSCFRKVISFFKIPWRRAWRLAGLALQILIKGTGAGFSVWRLRDVIPQLRRGLHMLRLPEDPTVCQHFRGKKHPTCMLVADAAQVYEQVKTELVLQAYDSKALELQSAHSCATITVKKMKGFWDGQVVANSLARALLWFSL